MWIQNLRPGSKTTLLSTQFCRFRRHTCWPWFTWISFAAFSLVLVQEQNGGWIWHEKCGSNIDISYNSGTLHILKSSVAVFFFYYFFLSTAPCGYLWNVTIYIRGKKFCIFVFVSCQSFVFWCKGMVVQPGSTFVKENSSSVNTGCNFSWLVEYSSIFTLLLPWMFKNHLFFQIQIEVSRSCQKKN